MERDSRRNSLDDIMNLDRRRSLSRMLANMSVYYAAFRPLSCSLGKIERTHVVLAQLCLLHCDVRCTPRVQPHSASGEQIRDGSGKRTRGDVQCERGCALSSLRLDLVEPEELWTRTIRLGRSCFSLPPLLLSLSFSLALFSVYLYAFVFAKLIIDCY